MRTKTKAAIRGQQDGPVDDTAAHAGSLQPPQPLIEEGQPTALAPAGAFPRPPSQAGPKVAASHGENTGPAAPAHPGLAEPKRPLRTPTVREGRCQLAVRSRQSRSPRTRPATGADSSPGSPPLRSHSSASKRHRPGNSRWRKTSNASVCSACMGAKCRSPLPGRPAKHQRPGRIVDQIARHVPHQGTCVPGLIAVTRKKAALFNSTGSPAQRGADCRPAGRPCSPGQPATPRPRPGALWPTPWRCRSGRHHQRVDPADRPAVTWPGRRAARWPTQTHRAAPSTTGQAAGLDCAGGRARVEGNRLRLNRQAGAAGGVPQRRRRLEVGRIVR